MSKITISTHWINQVGQKHFIQFGVFSQVSLCDSGDCPYYKMLFRIAYTLLVLGTGMIQKDFAGSQPIQGNVNMVEANESLCC